VKLENTN